MRSFIVQYSIMVNSIMKRLYNKGERRNATTVSMLKTEMEQNGINRLAHRFK